MTPRTTYSRGMRLPRWKELVWAEVASPRRLDLLIAAGLLAWGLPDVPWWWEYPGHAGSTPDVLGSLALTLAMSVPFCWRRRFPVPVLGLALGVLATRTLLHRNDFSAFAAVLVACYGLGAYSGATRRYARWLGWLALAAAVIAVFTSNGNRVNGLPFALLAAALVLGDAASARRAEAAAAVEAAHQAERTRIARELHDVVAHHISMVAVQAETARLTTPGLPAAGAQRFTEIGDTARAGLTEMRRLLGVLREDAEDVGAMVADRHPQPGLPQLAELIDAAREASGAAARLIVSGPVAEFDPGVELAAYRIVQEALTNARRHAPGAAVDVELRYDDIALHLWIRDNGPGPAWSPIADGQVPAETPGGRHGLLGMRERALAVGGSLRTGAAAGGGFFVEADLPAKPEVS